VSKKANELEIYHSNVMHPLRFAELQFAQAFVTQELKLPIKMTIRLPKMLMIAVMGMGIQICPNRRRDNG
jgi:ABC-type Fe3+-siderophore transport system permease subunit